MTLRLHDVSKAYGPVLALHPTSLALGSGQAVLLRGANGAGKSTLLALVVGLCRPTTGQVSLGGVPVAKARARLGYVPEGPAFDPRQTVRGLLSLCAALAGGDVAATEARLHLGEHREAALGTLSRGVRQRVALAQALLHAPALLVLDEPLTALDEDAQRRVVHALHEEKARGATLLIASHRGDAFAGLFDRTAVLEKGQLTWA